MQVVQVHVVDTKFLERLCKSSLDIFRPSIDDTVVPRGKTKLRGEENLVTLSRAFEPANEVNFLRG